MPKDVHIAKHSSGGWEVKREDARRASSVHRTQAEAIAAARRLALKSGGAEVVVDGAAVAPSPRAARSEGPRTTLRLPDALATTADRMAQELGISRNDAILRLATRGAKLYAQELGIAERRAARWAAVVPGVIDIEATEYPSPDEARAAILASDNVPGGD